MYSESLLTGKGVTIGEALSVGGETTIIGLSIVFAVLIVLMIVLMLFKVIFYRQPKPQAAASAWETKSDSAAAAEGTMDDEELVAVLTAAVAASLNTSTYNLRIKSYRRIDNKMPAWNKAGVNETINSRF